MPLCLDSDINPMSLPAVRPGLAAGLTNAPKIALLWCSFVGAAVESESVSRRSLPLDRWPIGCELLSAFSRNTALVVGDLLVRAGLL